MLTESKPRENSEIERISNSVQPKGSEWIPLLEYAVKNSVSLSTLRRYIKTGRIQYQVQGGKYFILDFQLHETPSTSLSTRATTATSMDTARDAATATAQQNERLALTSRVESLERALQLTQEEVTDLKMLLAIYEEKINITSFQPFLT